MRLLLAALRMTAGLVLVSSLAGCREHLTESDAQVVALRLTREGGAPISVSHPFTSIPADGTALEQAVVFSRSENFVLRTSLEKGRPHAQLSHDGKVLQDFPAASASPCVRETGRITAEARSYAYELWIGRCEQVAKHAWPLG